MWQIHSVPCFTPLSPPWTSAAAMMDGQFLWTLTAPLLTFPSPRAVQKEAQGGKHPLEKLLCLYWLSYESQWLSSGDTILRHFLDDSLEFLGFPSTIESKSPPCQPAIRNWLSPLPLVPLSTILPTSRNHLQNRSTVYSCREKRKDHQMYGRIKYCSS